MTIVRPVIGNIDRYREHLVSAHYVGPDCIAMVNGDELPGFYLTAAAARAAGRRFVDSKIAEQERPA